MYVCGTFVFLIAILSRSCIEGSLTEFSIRNHEFSAKLYKQLCKNETGNFIVSPLSTELVLELTAEGAVGSTYDELHAVLRLPASKRDAAVHIQAVLSSLKQASDDSLKVLLANKMYVSKDFSVKKTYKEIATTTYESDIEEVNFQIRVTADDINKWVEDQTNSKIKDLVDQTDIQSAAMLLINTLYFSGKWKLPFSAEKTVDHLFTEKKDKFEHIKMMKSPGTTKYGYHYSDTLKAKFLEIPFKSSDFSMICILPDATNGLSEKLESNLEDYLSRKNFSNEFVEVGLPKFSTSSEFDFTPGLKNMGVERLFDRTKADLGGISDVTGRRLYANSVKQKAVIDVSENGVEAAASSKAKFSLTSPLIEKSYTFIADHPFLYYITQKSSDVILFVGRFVSGS